MNEEDVVAKALELRCIGYNCAQSVADALVPDESLHVAMTGFGLGMGDSYGTCGAISGAIAALGSKMQGKTKEAIHGFAKSIKDDFHARNGSVICRDLKGLDTGKPLRECNGCIEDAVRIACARCR